MLANVLCGRKEMSTREKEKGYVSICFCLPDWINSFNRKIYFSVTFVIKLCRRYSQRFITQKRQTNLSCPYSKRGLSFHAGKNEWNQLMKNINSISKKERCFLILLFDLWDGLWFIMKRHKNGIFTNLFVLSVSFIL